MRYIHGRRKVLGVLPALLLLVALVISGCGGGGGGGSTAAAPIATPTATATPQPSPNLNPVLQGSYGLVSGAALGGNVWETEVGTITFNGQGGVTGGYGEGTAINLNTGVFERGTGTLTGGSYLLSGNREMRGSVNLRNTYGSYSASISGWLASNQVFLGGNTMNSFGQPGVFLIGRAMANTTNATLNGTYRISLVQAGATPGYTYGTADFDGAGNITGGTLHRSDGVDAAITGGTYAVLTDATFRGNVTAGGVTTTFYGFICADGTISFSIEDPLRLGVGIGTRGPASACSNADLSGTYGVGDLLISAANVPDFVDGYVVANGNGALAGGGVQYANGATTTITGGAYAIAADGTFTSGNVTQADGGAITTTFGTLHADKTVMSGTVRTNGGSSGLLLLIR